MLRDLTIRTISQVRPSLFRWKLRPELRHRIGFVDGADYLDIVDLRDDRTIRISRRNAVYCLDMAESFDYYFSSARPERILVGGRPRRCVDFSRPRWQHVAGFNDFPILCPSLTEPFVTAAQYLEFAQLRPGNVAVDLGAYSGLTSIAFSKAVGPAGRVVALEPDPINFDAATQNLARHREVNGLDNIALLPLAVSDAPGCLQLSSEGAMGSALTAFVGKSRGRSVEVETVTLAGLADRSGLERVDFIKMDIEGAESAAVTSSGPFLQRFKPAMIIEPHLIGGALTSARMVPFLEELGYRCAVIEQIGVSLPLITARHPDAPDRPIG